MKVALYKIKHNNAVAQTKEYHCDDLTVFDKKFL